MRFIVFAFLLLSSTAYAVDQLEFKGFVLGADLASVQNTGRFRCENSTSSIADTICSLVYGEKETIAGNPVSNLMMFFYSNKLETIAVYFQEKYFADVASALTEKYGQGEVTESVVQNKMGASFENKSILWHVGAATVEARRYAGRIDKSSVIYKTDSSTTEFMRRKGSSAKDKAKDL